MYGITHRPMFTFSNIREGFGSRYFALFLSTCQPSSTLMSLRRSKTCRNFTFKLKPSVGVWHVGDTCAVNYHVGSENVDPNADTLIEEVKPEVIEEVKPEVNVFPKGIEKVNVRGLRYHYFGPPLKNSDVPWDEERYEDYKREQLVERLKETLKLNARKREFEMKRAKQLYIIEKGLWKNPLKKKHCSNLIVKKVDRNKKEIMFLKKTEFCVELL